MVSETSPKAPHFIKSSINLLNETSNPVIPQPFQRLVALIEHLSTLFNILKFRLRDKTKFIFPFHAIKTNFENGFRKKIFASDFVFINMLDEKLFVLFSDCFHSLKLSTIENGKGNYIKEVSFKPIFSKEKSVIRASLTDSIKTYLHLKHKEFLLRNYESHYQFYYDKSGGFVSTSWHPKFVKKAFCNTVFSFLHSLFESFQNFMEIVETKRGFKCRNCLYGNNYVDGIEKNSQTVNKNKDFGDCKPLHSRSLDFSEIISNYNYKVSNSKEEKENYTDKTVHTSKDEHVVGQKTITSSLVVNPLVEKEMGRKFAERIALKDKFNIIKKQKIETHEGSRFQRSKKLVFKICVSIFNTNRKMTFDKEKLKLIAFSKCKRSMTKEDFQRIYSEVLKNKIFREINHLGNLIIFYDKDRKS